jgi:LysM repeat protein
MKQVQMPLILIFTFLIASFSQAKEITNFGSVTIFSFDASCMQQYDYQVDKEFILDDDHTAYHIHLDNERTLVLKVMKSEKSVRHIKSSLTTTYDCQSIKGIQPKFVIDVNSGGSPVFIEINGTYHKISMAEYNVDNDAFFSSFAPPNHSFVYEYNDDYDPLQTLRPVALDALDYETRNFYYSTEQEKTRQEFVYLQIYRDVCANRPYGIVTPLSGMGNENPFKYTETTSLNNNLRNSNAPKQIYRSCQHPVEVKHIKNVGMAQRSYIEDEEVYMSKLVSIDGKPVEKYLEENRDFNAQNTAKSADLASPLFWEYNLTKVVETNPRYAPEYTVGNPTVSVSTSKGAKRGSAANTPTQYNTKMTKEPLSQPEVTLSVPKINLSGAKHIVAKGETLYSISKAYKISVLDIKTDNQLSENTIKIGQELIIMNKKVLQVNDL